MTMVAQLPGKRLWSDAREQQRLADVFIVDPLLGIEHPSDIRRGRVRLDAGRGRLRRRHVQHHRHK